MGDLRWELASTAQSQMTLFEEVPLRTVGRGAYRGLEFLEVRAKSLINHLPPSPLPFRYTINAYRGCSHSCVYCFARPTHEYLGLGIGSDFDSKIVVKINAPELARAELDTSRWGGDGIAMGTNTDPYQAAEGKYRLTRGIVEALVEVANPFSILTKSPLVLRDLDVLADGARRAKVTVDFSIGSLDVDVWRASEPGTPHPRSRIDAVRRLNAAGIPSGVLMAPILPGLSDQRDQLREVVTAALDAGARFIAPMYLHVKPALKNHMLDWLGTTRPELVETYVKRYGGRTHAPAHAEKRLAAAVERLIAEHAPAGHPARRRRKRPTQRPPSRGPIQHGLAI